MRQVGLIYMLGWLAQEEGIRLEPSALAGMAGPQRVCASVSYQQMHGFSAEQLRNATHLVWATGGGMVPEEEHSSWHSPGRWIDEGGQRQLTDDQRAHCARLYGR